MTTDVTNHLSLADAANYMAVHRQSAWRYARQGTLVNGERITLRTARFGNRVVTKLEWIDEFGRKCAAAAEGPERPEPTKQPEKRKRKPRPWDKI